MLDIRSAYTKVNNKLSATRDQVIWISCLKPNTPIHNCFGAKSNMWNVVLTRHPYDITTTHLCRFSQILEFGESPAPFSQLSPWAVYFLPGLAWGNSKRVDNNPNQIILGERNIRSHFQTILYKTKPNSVDSVSGSKKAPADFKIVLKFILIIILKGRSE